MQLDSPFVTPIVAAFVGLAVWFIQSRVEAIRQAESRLRDERRKIYSDLLNPFINVLATPDESHKGHKRFDPIALKKAALELSLIGSDRVVRAFNTMMQAFYQADRQGREIQPRETLNLWGGLLLEVRKSVGDPRSRLTPRDMLRGIIKDIDDVPD